MASLNSGSSETGQELLDLTSELPGVRGYDLNLQREVTASRVHAVFEEPNSGLRLGIGIQSSGRLDHALDFVLVSAGAAIVAVSAAVICYLTDTPARSMLWIVGTSGAAALVSGLTWVVIRKK